MQITKLQITNFRNISFVNITPDSNINFITGHNGAGKTSILEAIHILSQGKSFKTARISSAINSESIESVLYCDVLSETDTNTKIGIQFSDKLTKLQVDENDVNSYAKATEVLAIQVISPDTVNLIISGPEARRNFINWGCFYTYPGFNSLWKKFRDCHKSRQILLARAKEFISNEQPIPNGLYNEIEVYTKVLCDYSYKLDEIYHKYLEKLIPIVKNILADFLPELTFSISYYRGWNVNHDLQDILKENLEKDIESGRGYQGLHRFDLIIKCFGEQVQNVLSRGQLKLLAIALKIAQGNLLKIQTESKCIYLIDDLAAELDQSRQLKFIKYLIADQCQIFMTYINNKELSIFNDIVDTWTEFQITEGKIIKTMKNGENVVNSHQSVSEMIDNLLK